MRSVVVVLLTSICAAIPMLRVHSIVYCRFGEFTDFGLCITASISKFDEQKRPDYSSAFGPRSILLLSTSENAQMPCWPGPFCALHRVCGSRCPGPGRRP